MKAVRIFAPGDIRVVDEPIQAVGKRQVLCKVEYVGICGTDYGIYRGELEDMVNFPVTSGLERYTASAKKSRCLSLAIA